MSDMVLEKALDMVAELGREVAGLKQANELYRKGMESQCELMDGLKQQARQQEAEIARLRESNAELVRACESVVSALPICDEAFLPVLEQCKLAIAKHK